MSDIQNEKRIVLVAGFIGLFAAVITGVGEFLLHYDSLARYSEINYDFMLGSTDLRQTYGHFFGVFGAPFYLIGMWHIYLMLKPASHKIALAGFFISSYGFMIGADWISSRASIGALIHYQASGGEIGNLVALYQLRYENLLTVIRVTTLSLSLIFIGLTLTGKSHYKKSQAIFSPIVLLLGSFIIYAVAPEIGKYIMPIALNVGFGIFFIMSLLQARKIN